MFSRFLGKGNKPDATPGKAAGTPRGIEVIEDDPETVWGLWDSALADQDSKFSAQSTTAAAPLDGSGDDGFPDDDQEVPTRPMALEEIPVERQRDNALAVVELHHQRIANTIRSMWGYNECSVYINKLIMSGGDGMGHSRIGFNQDAVDAMMTLSDLHDQQFGTSGGVGGSAFDPTIRAGLDGSR